MITLKYHYTLKCNNIIPLTLFYTELKMIKIQIVIFKSITVAVCSILIIVLTTPVTVFCVKTISYQNIRSFILNKNIFKPLIKGIVEP